MEQKEWDLQLLSDTLLQLVREHGIKEASMEQYEVVCRKIVRFACERGYGKYCRQLKSDFDNVVDSKVECGDVCYEYGRFQHRVMRMMGSLAETGSTDFSWYCNSVKRYNVSEESADVIGKVLDFHSLKGGSRIEMDTVLRHFFKYAEDKYGHPARVTDELLMSFFTAELPNTNKGSMGRSLRAIKYLSVYMKSIGNTSLSLDFTQLNARGSNVRVIPPYTQDEIKRALESIDTTTALGLRDYAIIMLAFDTGLRGVDIRKLCFENIDWRKGILCLRQSKTGGGLTVPLSAEAMNAVADYILNGRPESDCREVFLCAKGPARPFNDRHGSLTAICEKYFRKGNVKKVAFRSFHSLRRSFATGLSEAGVPVETISQLLGHKCIDEDKPYLSYNREQVSFCAIGFSEVPVVSGVYSGGGHNDDK